LLANYVILALLVRISDSSRRPAEPKPQRAVTPVPLAEANTQMVPLIGGAAKSDPAVRADARGDQS
jgi:hypothetical protein